MSLNWMSTFSLIVLMLVCLHASPCRASAFGPFYLTIADTYTRVEWEFDLDQVDDGVTVSYYRLELTDATDNAMLRKWERNQGLSFPMDDVQLDASLLTIGGSYTLSLTAVMSDSTEVVDSTSWSTRTDLDCEHADTFGSFFAVESYGPVPYPEYKFCGSVWTSYYMTPKNELDGTHRELVVYNVGLGTVVVAFRGTIRTLSDWLVNLDLEQRGCASSIYNGQCTGRVHDGFGDEYDRSRDPIRSHVRELIAAGFTRLIVTGHSQGAALATIAALDLREYVSAQQPDDAFDIRVVTLGSPRVGNGDFVNDWNAKLAANNNAVRFVATSNDGHFRTDPVTEVPFGNGYTHVQTELRLTFPDSLCDANTDLFLPCHSGLQYYTLISSSSTGTSISSWNKPASTTINVLSLTNRVFIDPVTVDFRPVDVVGDAASHTCSLMMLMLVSIIALLCGF